MAVELHDSDAVTTHLNMIVYGDTGVGKTYLIGTARKYAPTKNVLIVSSDEGLLTLKGMGVKVAVVNTLSDLEEVYDNLNEGRWKFDLVGVDSLTEIQDRLSLGTIKSELTPEGNYVSFSNVRQTTQPEWGVTGEHMKRVVRSFRSLSSHPSPENRSHVIMTCHEKFHTKRRLITPDLRGAMADEVGRYVDILARLVVILDENNVPRRFLQTVESEDDVGIRYRAKNRGGMLGAGIWNPTIKRIISAWFDTAPVEREKVTPPLTKAERRSQKDTEEENA